MNTHDMSANVLLNSLIHMQDELFIPFNSNTEVVNSTVRLVMWACPLMRWSCMAKVQLNIISRTTDRGCAVNTFISCSVCTVMSFSSLLKTWSTNKHTLIYISF